MKIWALMLLSILVSNCKSVDEESEFSNTTPPPAGKTFSGNNGQYVFAIGDVVEVNVRRNAKASGSYLIRNSGYIHMPIIGQVYAANRTASLIKSAIQIKLRPHFKYAKVSVITGRLASYKIQFSGKIRSPGAYSFNKKTTLLDGIARAGGISSKNANIILIRTDSSGARQRFTTDYLSLIRGTGDTDNVVLERGDLVFIN